MDYVIKNHKNVYIKLNDVGQPITCMEGVKGIFEYSKAKNILDNLPKTLKRLNFTVEPLPEITPIQVIEKQEEIVLEKENYILSEEVSRWLDKFGVCDEIISEAKVRKEELLLNLSNTDKELSNQLHKIELEGSKNAYQGFLQYKYLKEIMETRRKIKDELMIITNVLKMDFRKFSGDNVRKAIEGLANRKFTLRVMDDEPVEQN